MKQLKNRVAVITGAGSGIGRATALRLAQEGCQLALSDIDEAGLEETARLIGNESSKVTTHIVDASDAESMRRFADDVVESHEHVHIVVNNAGVALMGTLEENSLEDLEWLVGINFWGVVYGCKFFIPALRKEEEAHIINISSLAGLTGVPSLGVYSATKAAVRSWTESLSAELRGTGVSVSSIHPGGIATSIVANARLDGTMDKQNMMDEFSRRAVGPDHVANKIVSVLRSGRLRGLVCRETHVIAFLLRLMPETTQKLIGWAWARSEANRRASTARR